MVLTDDLSLVKIMCAMHNNVYLVYYRVHTVYWHLLAMIFFIEPRLPPRGRIGFESVDLCCTEMIALKE